MGTINISMYVFRNVLLHAKRKGTKGFFLYPYHESSESNKKNLLYKMIQRRKNQFFRGNSGVCMQQ
jgi:hypothetical protein